MRKFIFILLLFTNGFILHAQDTTFYDKKGVIVLTFENADRYEIIKRNSDNPDEVTTFVYFKSGQIKSKTPYSSYSNLEINGKYQQWYKNGKINDETDYENGKLNGKLKEWFKDGGIYRDVEYKNGLLHGNVLTYWENGNKKRTDKFENGKLIEGKCFSSNGFDTTYYEYEKRPEFQGGEDALYQFFIREITYPKKARKEGTEGTVYIQFVIEKDGSVSNVKIVKSVSTLCDEEALRVIKKMPKWKPGELDGKLVRISFRIPIKFALTD